MSISDEFLNVVEDLKTWLSSNKILYKIVDGDTLVLDGLGKLYINDLSGVPSIFRKSRLTGEINFNTMCDKDSLLQDGIDKVCFKFGDNWYWYDLNKGFDLNILKYVGKRQHNTPEVPFINLGIHTPFDLLNGSFKFSQWIAKAKHIGHTCIGICDHNTMAASLLLQKECIASGLNYVIGYTCDIVDGEDNFPVKVYCKNNVGLGNLLRLQKLINVDSETKKISINDLIQYIEGNVIVFGTLSSYWLNRNEHIAQEICDVCGYVYYQVDPNEYKADRIDKMYLTSLYEFYNNRPRKTCVKPVLICDTYYLDQSDAKNKIILNKVADGAAHNQSDQQYYKDTEELYNSFSAIFDSEKWNVKELFNECCENTIEIASGTTAGFETSRNFMPQYDMTKEEVAKYGTRRNMFNQILEEGFERLVPKGKEEIYRKRMEYEKYVIESTNNIDYFLVQYDTVNWATKQGIMTGIARGSGGGCLLLYLMGITKLDPLKYDLIFERFLLPDRSGLYESDVTIVKENIESDTYVKIDFGDRILKFNIDAEFYVKRGENCLVVYADELQPDDDILFDNRDLLWTLKE